MQYLRILPAWGLDWAMMTLALCILVNEKIGERWGSRQKALSVFSAFLSVGIIVFLAYMGVYK